MDGDEDYFDEDWDDTLQILEQNALAATQQQTGIEPKRPEAKDETTKVTGRIPVTTKSPWPGLPGQLPTRLSNAPPASAPNPPSSDYGFDDGDVIDLAEPSAMPQPTILHQKTENRMTASGNVEQAQWPKRRPPMDPETEAAFAAADAEMGEYNPKGLQDHENVENAIGDSDQIAKLVSRIAELEAERTALQRAQTESRSTVMQKQGEIAVLRSKHVSDIKEYDRKIAAMQKQHSEESMRHKAELEASKKEREKVETNNRFLQHDLAQETEKAKRSNGTARPRPIVPGGSTPRKNRRVNIGDGFDDHEVFNQSPTKNKESDAERNRGETPKLGNKRKRSAADSPIGALSFAVSPLPFRDDLSSRSQPSTAHSRPRESATSRGGREADHFHFMQQLVSYRTFEDRELALEALAKFRFPPGQTNGDTLSSLLTNGLAKPPGNEKESPLPLLLSRVLSGLWRQCLEFEHYAPLRILLDLLSFSIHELSAAKTSTLIEDILPLCTRTIRLVKNTDVSTSIGGSSSSTLDTEQQRRLSDEIDTDDVLDIVLHVCHAASLSKASIEHFWKNMALYDTLLMLHKGWNLTQILDGLEILRTSALSNSFGPISEDVTSQHKQETSIVDRLLNLLFENREATGGDPSSGDDEVTHLRITVLRLFQTLCEYEHGGLLLAQHRSAIGRLIQYLNAQVNRLYRTVLPIPLSNAADSGSHGLVTKSINMATRLLYHLLSTYDHVINMSEKLRVIRGGYHVFLLSMTRLAFSEQLVYEYGIDDEVSEAAHLILDTILSPEEGEAIREAVETPRGTRGSRPSDVLAAAKIASEREPIVGNDVTMTDADT